MRLSKRDKALTKKKFDPKKVYKDAMHAWEMNGVPLPNAHGGPLRMVTPGYFGINNVKHLGKVAFTSSESSVKYMKKSYRISPIGKKDRNIHLVGKCQSNHG